MARGGGHGQGWRCRGFPPDSAAVGQARRFLRAVLSDLPGVFGPELAGTLLMATNELAQRRTPCTDRVHHPDGGNPTLVRVKVSDENTHLPQLCLAPADATTGRGLALIDGSGLEWGVDRYPSGKAVWVQAGR